MHSKTRTWFLISLVCLILAGYFWHLSRERAAREARLRAPNPESAATPIKELGANNFRHAPPPLLSAAQADNGERPSAAAKAPRSNPLLTNRLSNTSKPLKELIYSDRAVLLRNALIDTKVTDTLNIPEHLRAKGDPGSYVVQSRGLLSDVFRAQLQAAGATVVSYIPNNAYLVRVSEAGAAQLRTSPQTQSVLPWEPYYKLDLPLLALAVQNLPLPDDMKLNVLVFPGQRDAGLKALTDLGAQLLGEDRSPFGHQLIVAVPLAHPMGEGSGVRANLLPTLAGLPVVQSIEIHHSRQLANDLTRPRIGLSTNSFSPPPDYLGLTGDKVLVNINDTGVDASHPDFDSRVTGDTIAATIDYDGHGTHVAGTIAGNGSKSGSVSKQPPGSSTNGWDFHGMAPKAGLFVQQLDLVTGPLVSDTYLQENAARTNAFISNNSWSYVDSLDYDAAAASYDGAVRDAVPGQPGSQPVLFVWAAGNSGSGATDGQGGQPESIGSPGTSKNGLTVGAIEKFRGITNEVVTVVGTNTVTNQVFYPLTDSDDEVAFYSSRGNVGIGLEGPAGRFKPDVVAPGSFVISCRAHDWTDPKSAGGVILNRIKGEVVQPGKANSYDITIPANGVQLSIITRSNQFSPNPFPGLFIYGKAGAAPDLTNDLQGIGAVTIPVAPGQYFYAVANKGALAVNYDLITVITLTNSTTGDYFTALANLNADLAPWYRYESGTSQAAPAVSGILALMQEFFEQNLKLTKDENWPALMKAMVINGAHSLGGNYDRQVKTALNLQGWGVVDLTNSLPAALSAGLDGQTGVPMVLFHTNTLYTGQSHTRTLAVSPVGQAYPLRFTLVWTDPPGNPAASVKLVNDLDLVVSNNIPDGEVYIGNNIPQGSDYNEVTDPTDTNAPLPDIVNNVENVYIRDPVASSYTVIVRAHRVNVNAVTDQTTGVLQDYALVISSGNTLLTNALTVSDISVTTQMPDDNMPFVQTLTNGVPMLYQRVGANNPLIPVLNNGITNQWNFYVYNNTSSFTNVAFVTFLSENLSRPRYLDADIDLYVSPDPNLTNLNAAVITDAINWQNGGRSARERGGTELIIYTNAGAGSTFYVGVKAEDQQAAEFGIFAIASDTFGGRDKNGNVTLTFNPLPAEIPDGSPEDPKGVVMIAVVADPAKVRRTIVTTTITHENGGDLYGILTHPGSPPVHSVVLNNHRSFTGTQTTLYDDSLDYPVPGSQVPDAPGHLRDFVGTRAAGVWMFTMVDNAQYHTGHVDSITGYIEPQPDLRNPLGITATLAPNTCTNYPIDVPFGVTNMIVYLAQKAPNLLPLDLYIRRADVLDTAIYDKKATINQPGGTLSFGLTDSPGLQPGTTYYIGVCNPNSVEVTFNLRVEFQYSVSPVASQTYFSSDTPKTLPDDAVTNSLITVTNNRAVADVQVGVRIDHPRLSDLVVHLVSPQGTRILLTENRGGSDATNYGFGFPVSYHVDASANGGATEARTNIDTGHRSGVVQINYDFFNIPDDLRIYYDGNRIFDSGLINGAGTFSINYGPGLSTVVTIVMNEGNNPDPTTQWQYSATITGPWNYTTFTDDPNLAGPIKFALPPYYVLPTNRMVLSDSFEAALATNYAQFDTFENWQVLTNGVAVLTDTNHPLDGLSLGATNWGTNFLALSSGQVALPLTNIVVPDRDYVLTFAQRKVSSSPTQSLDFAVSQTANIYASLNVFNPPANSIDVAQHLDKVRLCPGQQVSLTAVAGSEGDTNNLYQGLPMFSLIGCFSFSPEMLTSNTAAGAVFYIGTNAVITAPTDPGDYYLFVGINNNDYNNPPPATTNAAFAGYTGRVSWQQCQYASGEVALGANSFPITGTANWSVQSQRFLANPTMTNLVLRPDINTTLLFDSFQIDELVSTAYYQSEEPMAPFQGQLAMGDWRLEVWDNRGGPINSSLITNDTGSLFSWSLRFVFADSPAAVPLTNGVPYTNVVSGSQIKYFVVAVPNEVTAAANLVTSTGPGVGGVNLLYSPFGLPIGQVPPDPVPAIGPGAMPYIVTTTTPAGAALPQGRLYYLGVQNVNPAEVNNFTIQVDFNIPITPLVNGTLRAAEVIAANPYSFTDVRANTSLAVTNMNYYYFDIASPDITSATIQLFPTDGNVNLVLRRALPAVDLFPRPTFFDYESTLPGVNSDLIIVNSNSLPIALSPGRWYVGVYNTVPDANVHYDILATWSATPLWNYVDLTNATPVPFSVSSYVEQTNFYRFVVGGTANSGVLFEIYNLDGDADLLVRRADLPVPDLYDFSFLQTFNPNPPFNWLPEYVGVRTNIFVPDLNATNWFLQIVSPRGGVVNGTVCAKVNDPITGSLLDCQGLAVVGNAFIQGGAFSFTWNSVPGEKYAVLETADLKSWFTAKVITATTPTTSFATPAPRGSPPRFYRIQQVPP